MGDKKVWEFEGDWYIQPKEGLQRCVNNKDSAELFLKLLDGIDDKIIFYNEHHYPNEYYETKRSDLNR